MTEPRDVPAGSYATPAPVATDDALPGTTRRERREAANRRGGGGRSKPPGDGEPTGGRWRVAAEWVGFIVAAILIAFVVKTWVFAVFYIPSGSMLPTLEVGDRVAVSKLSYRLHDVRRGDIVVFEAPEGTRTADIRDLVKRVVGLPGERIEGRDGRIYIDGQVLEEPWLPAGTQSSDFECKREYPGHPGCVDGVIPPDTYFVLGDNRLSSKDSTFFGPIEEDWIVGRVFVRIWPLDRLAFIGPSYWSWIIAAVAVVILGFVVSSLWSRSRAARGAQPRAP
jgi:signal peptidase I